MMQLFSYNLVLIRLTELISVPKHSQDSCILIKLNTLFSRKECVRPNWCFWCYSRIWTYLYNGVVFLQFRVLIRHLELIYVPNHSRDSCILFKLNTMFSWKACLGPNRVSGINHSIVHIFIMQLFPLISGFDSASKAHFRPETFQRFIFLIKLNTLFSWKECVRPNWSVWYKSPNWAYLNDTDVFFNFEL